MLPLNTINIALISTREALWTCQVTPVTSTDAEPNRSKPCRAASNLGALWLPTTTEMADMAMAREAPNTPVAGLRIFSEANTPCSTCRHSIAKSKPDIKPLEYTRVDTETNLGEPNCQRSSDLMHSYSIYYIISIIYIYIYSFIMLLKRHCFSVEPK